MPETPTNEEELALSLPDDGSDAAPAGADGDSLEDELSDAIALEDEEGGAADEQLSVIEEAGEGDVANELDDDTASDDDE